MNDSLPCEIGGGINPKRGLAIRNVRLFDSETGGVRDDQTVLVIADRIKIAGADTAVAVPADTEVIDGTGQTLLPGLVDMHVHLCAQVGVPTLRQE
jgi:imidazolonepropionase-like amidohydrolase